MIEYYKMVMIIFTLENKRKILENMDVKFRKGILIVFEILTRYTCKIYIS